MLSLQIVNHYGTLSQYPKEENNIKEDSQ